MIDQPEPLSQVRARALVPRERCPMARSAELLGDRWVLLILREAFYGVVRYDDMRVDLGASRSTLTAKLNLLVDHGILVRRSYQEDGARPRDAYLLTDAGRDLALALHALSEWGERHILKGPSPVDLTDRRTGQRLHLALVDEEGQTVALSSATLALRERVSSRKGDERHVANSDP